MRHYKYSSLYRSRQSGYSLLEVVIGIAIFAIGMLALASLQGALTRSTAESKVRTEAVNIAEEVIEAQRGIRQVLSAVGTLDYGDIRSSDDADNPWTNNEVTRNNVTYTVTQNVGDYLYDSSTDSFIAPPVGVSASDYKSLIVRVAWGTDREFLTYNDDVKDDFEGGFVQVSSIISATPISSVGRIAEESERPLISPPVSYEPGARPDIVALSLGDSRFKESLTPEPKTTNNEELVDTRFDVITYSSNNGFEFLRREEFAAVSCECELKAKPVEASDGGRRPALWLGDEYLQPEFVAKPYGISANGQQSPLCDACCQDHHDGGTGAKDAAYGDGGAILYNPYRASGDYLTTGTFAGDHRHYKKDRRGNLSVATAINDTYVEACRLVRKDGFFRVAQDFSMQDLNVFPYDYLVSTADVTAYSNWLTDEVDTFADTAVADGYGAGIPFVAPPFIGPTRTAYPSTTVGADDLTLAWTELPTPFGDFQQLRSRGIYIDYIIKDLRDAITCLNRGDDAETCRYGDVYLDKVTADPTTGINILEITPFFEVQMTYLNQWSDELNDVAVEVTNDPVETGNTHSRGVVSEATGGGGFEQVTASGSKGVLGFTDTDPIDESYNPGSNTIDVHLNNTGTPNVNGTIVTGTISSGVTGVQARSVVVTGTNAICNYVGVTFTCLVPSGVGAILQLSNYHKSNDKDIVACSSDTVTLPPTQGSDNDSNPWTKFNLDGALDSNTVTYQISIEPTSCDDYVPGG